MPDLKEVLGVFENNGTLIAKAVDLSALVLSEVIDDFLKFQELIAKLQNQSEVPTQDLSPLAELASQQRLKLEQVIGNLGQVAETAQATIPTVITSDVVIPAAESTAVEPVASVSDLIAAAPVDELAVIVGTAKIGLDGTQSIEPDLQKIDEAEQDTEEEDETGLDL